MDEKEIKLQCLILVAENGKHYGSIDIILNDADRLYNFVVGKRMEKPASE